MATAKTMTERETSAALLDGFSKREALEFAAKQVVKRGGTPSEKFWRTVHRTISEHGRVKAKRTASKAKSKSAPKSKKAAGKSKSKAAPSGDRGAKVWAWLKKTEPSTELTYDAKLWSPAEWRKHGADPGKAVFVITTEGPLYQLVNGHYETPAGEKLNRDFNKMLKSLGLWYDMGSAVELYFYDKND